MLFVGSNRYIRIHSHLALACLMMFAGCSRNGDPYRYVHVYGTITYEDGSIISVKGLMLKFLPETPPISAKAFPGAGWTIPDPATGKFEILTTHEYNDGLVRGKHRVIISGDTGGSLPTKIIPAEYANRDKTPLEVDTDQLPFDLKVRKP